MQGLEVQKAIKVRLYRNDDSMFFGKDFVVNRRQIRTFPAFLNAVTSHIGMPEQVNAVVTPRKGTQVVSLGDLEDHKEYVAVGRKNFKNIG